MDGNSYNGIIKNKIINIKNRNMSLVIKSLGTTAPEGAEKLYRDALVQKGSLFCVDFSNRGTLENFSLSPDAPVLNLAREAASELGVVTIANSSFMPGHQLTEGKGVVGFQEGSLDQDTTGISFEGNLFDYLVQNQPNSLAILWVDSQESAETPHASYVQVITSAIPGETNVSGDNLRSTLLSGEYANLVFGGSGLTGSQVSNLSGRNQLAVEFRPGQTNRVFINGVYIGDGSSVTEFEGNQSHFGLGRINQSRPSGAAAYRILIEDLEVSGRTADEVVLKDYNYVHALGEFEGIPKRPFVDAY